MISEFGIAVISIIESSLNAKKVARKSLYVTHKQWLIFRFNSVFILPS